MVNAASGERTPLLQSQRAHDIATPQPHDVTSTLEVRPDLGRRGTTLRSLPGPVLALRAEEDVDEFPWHRQASHEHEAHRGRSGYPYDTFPHARDPSIEEIWDEDRPEDPLIRPRRAMSRRSMSRISRRSTTGSVPPLYRRASSRGTIGSARSGGGKKVRRVELWLTYCCFFILGSAVLLSWNSEIVAGRYFKARLEGSVYEASCSSFVAVTYTVGNLIFLAHANATQAGANLTKRMQYSLITHIAVFIVLAISTTFEQIDPTFFFIALIACTILLTASGSYIQNAAVALASHYGPHFLQGILSGQGAIGVAVASVQFVSAYTAASALSPVPTPDDDIHALPSRHSFLEFDNPDCPHVDPAITRAAFTFFLAVTAFACLCIAAHLTLTKLPLYERVVPHHDAEDIKELKSEPSPIWEIERKVRKLGISMLGIFIVTLSLFPSLTSSVLSVNKPGENSGIGSTLSEPHLFVPLGFITYAVGDWIGRLLPQAEWLRVTDWRVLMSMSAGRVVFVPLFLLCNVEPRDSPPLFDSDFLFLAIMFLFSLSNGFTSSLIFLAAVVEPSLDEDEIEVAATILAFYLTSGLAIGSLMSFAVKALLCHCNPFT